MTEKCVGTDQRPRWTGTLGGSLAVASVTLALNGCGAGSDSERIASAKQYLAANNNKAAAVELRAALQKNPDAAEARFLFGKALLGIGDPGAAVVELEKARSLAYPDAELLPVLAAAWIASGQPKKVIDNHARVTLNDRKADAELKTMLATAYALQKDAANSQAAVDAALQSDPTNVAASLLATRLQAGRGEIDGALATVEALIAKDPKQSGAWVLKGELLWSGKGDPDGAARAFRQALAVDPKQMRAVVALISLGAANNDLAAYKTQIAELEKARPDDFESRYFVTQLALLEGDLKKARDGAQLLLRMAPDYALALQLAGAVELQVGALGTAQRHLLKAVLQEPDSVGARQMLAQAYVRSGQSARAISTLQPLLSKTDRVPADILALAADAYRLEGDLERAERLYAQAAKADPQDPKPRVALAVVQIGRGNFDSGLLRLEAMASSDPATHADLALVSALIKRKDHAAALKAVDRLQSKMQGKALPYHLRGQILLASGDAAGARKNFEKALNVDPAFYPVVADLANLDLAEKKPAEALKRFEAVLAREPENFRALLAVADLRQRAGAKPEEIEKLLGNIVRLNSGEPAAYLALVQHQLNHRRAKAALAAAEEGVAAVPDSAELMDALGRAQMAAGDSLRAMQTFQKIVTTHPAQPMPHLRLADIYLARSDYAAAIQSLRKAIDVSPQFVLAQRKLIQVLVSRKQPAEAIKVARQVQTQRPNEAIGWLIEGEIHLTQRSWSPAVEAYLVALQRERSTEVARRLHSLYAIAGRQADADSFAADWLRERPSDLEFVLHLGSMEMDRKNYAAAEQHFRKVLAQRPDDPAVLNNVAWLILEQKKPGAMPLLERALQIAPGKAELMDTMAAALAEDKQVAKALEWQRKAVAAAPGTPVFRLRLARLLIVAGERAQARVELEKLAALGGRYNDQAEVSAMLKAL